MTLTHTPRLPFYWKRILLTLTILYGGGSAYADLLARQA